MAWPAPRPGTHFGLANWVSPLDRNYPERIAHLAFMYHRQAHNCFCEYQRGFDGGYELCRDGYGGVTDLLDDEASAFTGGGF